MLTLPDYVVAILAAFAPLFSRPVFAHMQILLVGAILSPGQRTVASALRAMGLSQERHFQSYHRVLNRAHWSSRKAAKILLCLLVSAFAKAGQEGALVIGIDESLERRRGDKIEEKGIYRDSVRSSKTFFVKSSGLRWISLMLLTDIAWAKRIWALPFFAILAPSERYDKDHKRRHKSLSYWAQQMITQVRRWLPNRPIVLVADSAYAVFAFLERCQRFRNPVTVITRLRLDAGLYEALPKGHTLKVAGRPRKVGKRLPSLQKVQEDPETIWQSAIVPCWYGQENRTVEIVSATCVWYHGGKPPVPIRWVLVRDPQGKFTTQALLSTHCEVTPQQILSWFVQRWQLETTFHEVRTHLGVETQRQWSRLAICDRRQPCWDCFR